MAHAAPQTWTYPDALADIRRALAFGIHPSLDGITALAGALDNPQSTYSCIQVTGTNGKTSTVRLIDALLRAEGQRSGYYTSPELIDYTERISYDGADITPQLFAQCYAEVAEARNRLPQTLTLTEFELLTALALDVLRATSRDFAVLEVGLGGHWDATSVVNPAVSVITGVGLDHTRILGNTVQEIAADKAHIIKAGSTPVLGYGFDDVLPVFLERAHAMDTFPRVVRKGDEKSPVPEGCTTRFYDIKEERDENVALVSTGAVVTPHATYDNLRVTGPAYQMQNVATALTAAESALGRPLHDDRVRQALEHCTFPARFEVVKRDPLLLFDGGHNPQAATHLVHALDASGLRPVAAMGIFADKDWRQVLKIIAPHITDLIAIEIDHPRALPAGQLAQEWTHITGKQPLKTLIHPTLRDIRALVDDKPLLITGSLSLYSLLKS